MRKMLHKNGATVLCKMTNRARAPHYVNHAFTQLKRAQLIRLRPKGKEDFRIRLYEKNGRDSNPHFARSTKVKKLPRLDTLLLNYHS